MGEILGIGVTHYPGLIQPDQQMAGLLDRTLNSDQVPEAMKDPARWPAQMRKEWADPLAAAKEPAEDELLYSTKNRCPGSEIA